jgi:protein-L-isoaspartate(D-aspartate) O-methyltransferase
MKKMASLKPDGCSGGLGAIFVALAFALSACAAPTPTVSPGLTPTVDGFAARRRAMVDDQIRARGVRDPEVLHAMETVPRHEFVPEELMAQAYEDHPLPIGSGQTISQPYIVAAMTELAQVKRGDRVLEIGTGSGYQAAVLAMLTDQVYSVEIIPALAETAAARLKRLGYGDIKTKQEDGYFGWEEYAPFDAILVTAASDHIPPLLVAQLKDGGRMIIPVGPTGSYQTLWRVNKRGDKTVAENIMGVLFVPLTRGK